MGKHTPGPWTVQGDGYDTATYVMGRDVLVRGGEADRIIAVCHSYGPLDRFSRLHNARLIAAAPDLLEALDELLDALDHGYVPQKDGELLNGARAAIAKATA